MSKWEVGYRLSLNAVKTEVDADTYSEALTAAREAGEADAKSLGLTDVSIEADVIRQTGEPWVVAGIGGGPWYDLHGPGDVIVLSRAHGNAFTQAQVDLLGERLAAMGLAVVASWNGAGTNQVSFRCRGRDGEGPMSEEHVKALLAPIPGPDGEQ